MTKVLVTGFEPFGGDAVNASLEGVRRLPERSGELEIATAELPTSFSRSLPALERAIAHAAPEVVLCVGQANERAALCVERVAINMHDARIADNDGALVVDVPVLAGGPAAYFSTLPIKAIAAALQAARLPAQVSNSAGTFVCNHVFYGLMHLVATRALPVRAGMLHVPPLLKEDYGQAANVSPACGMALDDIVRGILIVLEVAVGRREHKR